MTLVGYLALASFALILGLKIYSVYRRSELQKQMSEDGIPPEYGVRSNEHLNSEISSGDSNSESSLDWGEILLIVVSLGFCAPLGLILLWKTDRLDSKTKTVITLSYAAVVMVGVVWALALD